MQLIVVHSHHLSHKQLGTTHCPIILMVAVYFDLGQWLISTTQTGATRVMFGSVHRQLASP